MASILKIGTRWRALIRRTGHKSICKTHPSKAAAEAWARKVEAQLDTGRAPSEERLTVAEMIRAYRKLRDKARPISDSSNEHYMLKHLEEGLGVRIAARLTPEDVVGYCTMRRDQGAGPYTCNMDVSKLSTVLRYAAMSLKVQLPDAVGEARSLLKHLGLIGDGGKRERRPTDDELTRVLEHLERERGAIYADFVRLAVLTTMRRGEIARLMWSDVDEAKRLVLVRDRKHPRKKVGNHEWVPLLGEAWDVLQRQPRIADEPRIFPRDPTTVSKYFTNACRALAIPDLHLHDMRHEGTSKLFEEGYSIEQVALVTGHKDWRQLRRYTNLRPEDLHK